MNDAQVLNEGVVGEEPNENDGVNKVSTEANGEKIYTITDLANMFHKSPATIRNWEKEMQDVITVSRSPQGARYYTENDVTIFKEIDKWRKEGFSLENISKLLNSMKSLSQDSETEVMPFSGPAMNSDILGDLERIIEKQFNNHSGILRLGSGESEEEKEDAHISRESAKRRVEARLKSKALKEWAKEPESKRYIKNGLFRKEENLTERDSFIEVFIAEYFEEEYRREIKRD